MSVQHRTVIHTPLPERTTQRFTAAIRDHAGAAIPEADLTTLTLTLYNEATGSVVNDVNDTNILNAGRGAVDANGLLTLTLTPLDLEILDSAQEYETRILLIEWTYNAGADAGRHEIQVVVRNLTKVP